MNELYAVLLSWAVTLTGYQMPANPPEVVKVPHSYLIEKALRRPRMQGARLVPAR